MFWKSELMLKNQKRIDRIMKIKKRWRMFRRGVNKDRDKKESKDLNKKEEKKEENENRKKKISGASSLKI